MVFTWSELHIVWAGIVTNVINLVIKRLETECDDWPELLAQCDAAYRRWASPMATVRGKTKRGGLSSLLAREGDLRLSRCTSELN